MSITCSPVVRPVVRRAAFGPIALAVLFFAFVPTLCLAGADADRQGTGKSFTIHLSNGDDAIQTSLVIGDDLHVGLSGAPAQSSIRIDLLDEQRQVVAGLMGETDGAGAFVPTPLWYRTGVVGCDRGAQVDPSAYRFRDFDHAEALLGGVRLTVEVHLVGSSGPLAGTVVDLEADRSVPRFFFADGSGCPRSEMMVEEAVYLAGRSLSTTAAGWTVFFIEGGEPALGDALVDVRPEHLGEPQWIAGGASSLLELLWVANAPGGYGAVVRQGADPTPTMEPGDDWLGGNEDDGFESTSPHGITIRDWPCDPCATDPGTLPTF